MIICLSKPIDVNMFDYSIIKKILIISIIGSMVALHYCVSRSDIQVGNNILLCQSCGSQVASAYMSLLDKLIRYNFKYHFIALIVLVDVVFQPKKRYLVAIPLVAGLLVD